MGGTETSFIRQVSERSVDRLSYYCLSGRVKKREEDKEREDKTDRWESAKVRREIGEEVGEISGFRRRREGSLHLVVVDREGGDLPVCMLEVP